MDAAALATRKVDAKTFISNAATSKGWQVRWLWDLYFWSLKGFGRFKAVASLDAYQITNYQFPLKTYDFSVA